MSAPNTHHPPSRRQMLAGVCTTLLAAATALSAAGPLQASEQDPSELACRHEPASPRRAARAVVVVDDPSLPLDAKDPYYAEKLAARYRRWIAQVL